MFAIRSLAACSLLVLLAGGAQANVLYDNTSVGVLGTDPISGDGPQYDSFTTDASGTINTIQLMLDSTGDVGGVVEVDIFDDAGNTPNGFINNIGFVADSELSSSPTLFSFTSVGMTLDPNTRYWVGLTDNSGVSNLEWAYAADASGTGVAGEFNANSGGRSPMAMATAAARSPTSCASAAPGARAPAACRRFRSPRA